MDKQQPPISVTVSNVELLNNELKEKYDSVFAFQDVDWITYKGIGEKKLSTTSLKYPLTIFCYNKNVIDLLVYYSEKDIVKRCVKTLFKNFDISSCSYYSRDEKDTIVRCEYFLPNLKKLEFVVSKSDFSAQRFSFEGFTVWSSDAEASVTSVYFGLGYSKKHFLLEDCITQISKGKVPEEYEVNQVQKFEISKKNFLKIYDKRIDKEIREENRENNDRVIQYENLASPSFFYHYTKLFNYCKCD